VHVHPQFLAGEEKETESVFTKNRRAQGLFPTALNVVLCGEPALRLIMAGCVRPVGTSYGLDGSYECVDSIEVTLY
jgi:hypothetical protein